MYQIPRRRRIGSARENASASTYRAAPANVLSLAKPQKSHAALQTLVTEKSQTAGSSRFRILRLVPMVRTAIGWAVCAVGENGRDTRATFANRISSDDCDAAVHASAVLVNDIAECIALDGELLAFPHVVVQL